MRFRVENISAPNNIRSGTLLAHAPSNIALIKYMGKKDSELNLPENSSLSITLDSLRSYVELEPTRIRRDPNERFIWEKGQPLSLSKNDGIQNLQCPSLSDQEVQRMIGHLGRSRDRFLNFLEPLRQPRITHKSEPLSWTVRTCNTFPKSAGVASSASSFAAMTLAAAVSAWEETFWAGKPLSETGIVFDGSFQQEVLEVSRMGSGSSSRSFHGPWNLWDGHKVEILDSVLPAMTHFLMIVSHKEKPVSSSQAHLRIRTSPLWNDRVIRVAKRIAEARDFISRGDLRSLSRITWDEMWEMHSLFHTSAEPFTYWEPETVEILKAFQIWRNDPMFESHFGPFLLTMDAGPNVHLLVPEIARDDWKERLEAEFPKIQILQDRPAFGAEAKFFYDPLETL